MAETTQFGIDLQLDEAVAQGHYSNLAIISRSLQENIVRYESSVGKIEIPTPAGTPDAGPKMGQA